MFAGWGFTHQWQRRRENLWTLCCIFLIRIPNGEVCMQLGHSWARDWTAEYNTPPHSTKKYSTSPESTAQTANQTKRCIAFLHADWQVWGRKEVVLGERRGAVRLTVPFSHIFFPRWTGLRYKLPSAAPKHTHTHAHTERERERGQQRDREKERKRGVSTGISSFYKESAEINLYIIS